MYARDPRENSVYTTVGPEPGIIWYLPGSNVSCIHNIVGYTDSLVQGVAVISDGLSRVKSSH